MKTKRYLNYTLIVRKSEQSGVRDCKHVYDRLLAIYYAPSEYHKISSKRPVFYDNIM